ncbi:MAG: 50S ribosomal protein L3 N(5)-glutamine methyltransferase [Proteobacteria bacterium]|nr:50S ribosomal protein L3 N(5)-glutamine methyltransferase [Pseudomonadota bacterium]
MPKNQKVENELLTVRDFIRHGVSCFNKAGIVYGHGTDNAFDEATYLVLETLHLPVNQLEPYLDARLTKPERKAVATILDKRITTRKPAAYLTHKAYIQGLSFYVDERVLVPRSLIGELLCSDFILADNPATVLDLCTGSGCLAILAAHVFPSAQIDATDLSPDALAIAKKNVKESDCADRITLYKGDLFKPLKNKKYDLIITNPPYVDKRAMKDLPPEYRHEPRMALASGDDGLDIIRRILAEAPQHLMAGGGLLCEIGRGRDLLEAEYPHLEFLWLDTETSAGEVFWLTRGQLTR